MNLQDICYQVIELSRKTGAYLREERSKLHSYDIEQKGENNFVTYIDKEAERMLVKGLSEIVPQAGFLTEEGSVDYHNEEYYWVVDPLDGTSNYLHHLAPYAVSVALMNKNDILLGCIYEVTLNETFYAWKGGKAWLNDREINVSKINELNKSFICYGIPYDIKPEYEYLRERVYALQGKCTMRLLGSAATELCYVAAGRIDAYFHDSLAPWDVAAGIIILKEAGGMVSDFSGSTNYIFGGELIATNHHLHDKLFSFLKNKKSDG